MLGGASATSSSSRQRWLQRVASGVESEVAQSRVTFRSGIINFSQVSNNFELIIFSGLPSEARTRKLPLLSLDGALPLYLYLSLLSVFLFIAGCLYGFKANSTPFGGQEAGGLVTIGRREGLRQMKCNPHENCLGLGKICDKVEQKPKLMTECPALAGLTQLIPCKC